MDREKLPEYSQHFGAMFNFRGEFTYEGSSITAAAASTDLAGTKVKILSVSEFDTVSLFLSAPTMKHVILREQNGKAAECSGVSAELMIPVASMVASVLSLIAEIMFCTGLCPQSFKKSNIMPVPKKTHSNNINDFRPISLTEVPKRIIEKCLALYLKPFERNLSPMQGGFRERHSTLDQAAVLQQVLSTRSNDCKPTVVAFLDIKAAYDSVDRHLLWACCKRAKIPDLVIRMLSGMFDHNESRVVIDGGKGKWFKNRVGLMQGSSPSPLLYALYIDGLPKMLLSNFPSISLGNNKLNSVLYADDIALGS